MTRVRLPFFCPFPSSTSLHPLAPRPLRRFLATMGALTPARAALRLSWSMNTVLTPHRSPCVLRYAIMTIPSPPTGRTPTSLSHATLQRPSVSRVSRAEISPCASRLIAHARPYRVRHPTDWSFPFNCSPPRLAATQLSLGTGRRAYAWRGLPPLCRGAIAGALRRRPRSGRTV